MLSISTCWNSARHTDGAAMLEELLELGFDAIELSHGIRRSLLPGILDVVESGRVRFSSLHNFCPLPIEISTPSPDCLLFTSHRREERERAVRQTIQTIAFAAQLKVPTVILHCGRVLMKPVTQPLMEMAKQGKHLDGKYARLKMSAVPRRERLFANKYLPRLTECLDRLVEQAASKGVRLGLESRQFYEEIPTERDLDILLERYPTETVGYWHDFGHTQTRENLGFVNHAEFLQKMKPRLLGCHVHETVWPAYDHQIPWCEGGSTQFATLAAGLSPKTPYVWEMSARQKKEDIVASLERWKKECRSLL